MAECPKCNGEIEVLYTSTVSSVIDQDGKFTPFCPYSTDLDIEVDVLCIVCGTELNSFFECDLDKTKIFNKRNKWKEIRNNFFDEEERCISIDGWKTKNNNEEGKVIAKVYVDTKKIEYIDETAKLDKYAQEIIEETRSIIDAGEYCL